MAHRGLTETQSASCRSQVARAIDRVEDDQQIEVDAPADRIHFRFHIDSLEPLLDITNANVMNSNNSFVASRRLGSVAVQPSRQAVYRHAGRNPIRETTNEGEHGA
jgi:hypothetical protein